MDGFVRVPTKTWFLVFSNEKSLPETKANISVAEWDMPEVKDYLKLYKEVGAKYGWTQRLLMEKRQLAKYLNESEISVFLFKVEGKKAGYFEIDFSMQRKAEIVYLGLLPNYVGKGYGKAIIHEAVRIGAAGGSRKVWLHTCEYDHAQALETYMKAGFEMYKEEILNEPYPKNHPLLRSRP